MLHNTKPQFRWLPLFLIFLTLGLCSTSCKDKDGNNEKEEEKELNQSLIGIWAELEEYESGADEVFCLQINEDLSISELFWDRINETFIYEDKNQPYTSILKQEGDIYQAYDYDSGKKHDQSYKVVDGILHQYEWDRVYLYKKIR